MDGYKKDDLIDNRYMVKDKLGGGGFGKVLNVLDQQNEDIIALKYCTSFSEEDIRRFKREVRIMESIDHENVIKVLDSNVEYNQPYFTMHMALYSVTETIPILEQSDGDIWRRCNDFESI